MSGDSDIVETVKNLLENHEKKISNMMKDHIQDVRWWVESTLARSDVENKLYMMKSMEQFQKKVERELEEYKNSV